MMKKTSTTKTGLSLRMMNRFLRERRRVWNCQAAANDEEGGHLAQTERKVTDLRKRLRRGVFDVRDIVSGGVTSSNA